MKRLVFNGKLLKVYREKLRLPNSYVINLEIIKHPGATLVIPFLRKDRIILLKQFRPVIRSYIYELPAGTLDEKESFIKCARREIVEEIGYTAKKFTRLGAIFPVPGYSTEKIVIFKAQSLRKVKREFQHDEIIETFIVDRTKLRHLFKTGKIVDAKTIAAFAFCGWL